MGGEAPVSGVARRSAGDGIEMALSLLSSAGRLDLAEKLYREGVFTYAEYRASLEASPAICTVTVPVKTVSELNRHEHWRIRAKRARSQHLAVQTCLLSRGWPEMVTVVPPLHVHLTRLSARKLDTDNLAGALKHCRDAVAKFLGVDDGDEAAVSWSVGQERQKGYAVRVEFYRRQS